MMRDTTHPDTTGVRYAAPLIGYTAAIKIRIPLPVIGSIDATAFQLEEEEERGQGGHYLEQAERLTEVCTRSMRL